MSEAIEARELDWDEEISFDGQSVNYVTLEPGEYTVEVTKFERSEWGGSAKIPKGTRCVTVYFKVETPDGIATFTDDFPMWTIMKWKIVDLFCCVGLCKRGDNGLMKWDELVGTKGRAKIKKRSWTGRDGEERWSNNVDKYLDPKPAAASATAAPKTWSL